MKMLSTTVPCIGLLQELIDSLQELFTTICLESFFLSVALGCNRWLASRYFIKSAQR